MRNLIRNYYLPETKKKLYLDFKSIVERQRKKNGNISMSSVIIDLIEDYVKKNK